jgi:peptidoglycan/xylan/chitin deacetylase (PgdA/CDA1 family)
VDSDGELWWDELERIFLAESQLPSDLEILVAGQRVVASFDGEGPVPAEWRNHQATESPRARTFLRLWGILLTLGVDDRDATMEALAAWSGRPRTARPERRLLTSAELASMVASPAAEVGSHTVRHPNLTLPNDRVAEVAGSRTLLEEMIGEPVTTFAYPNGYHDAAAVAAVADAGYRGACTTEPGIVTGATGPFTVPRIGAPDVDGDAFERFVRALG